MADLSLQKSSSLARLGFGRGGSLFLYVGIGAFAAVLITLGGLLFLNRAREAMREEFIAENEAKKESLRPELLNQIILLDKRLKGARDLLTGHNFASNVFRVIEANTHPQVRFANLVLSADALKTDMSGEAASYSAISRQVAILEREAQIEKVEFGGLSTTGEGLVGFKLSLIFKPTLLRLRP